MLAGRSEFKESLKTTDSKAALIRYVDAHERAEQFFTSLLMGEVPSRSIHRPVARLKELSQTFDLDYRPATELIKDDNLDEILKRYGVWAKAGKPKGPAFDAIFGEEDDPIKLSDALAYHEEHTRDQFAGIDPRAKQKKLNPIRLAIKEFQNFSGGDIDIAKVDRSAGVQYRSHLIGRIENSEIKSNTANKLISGLRMVYTTNIEKRGINLSNPFVGLSIMGEVGSRPALSIEFIRNHWFKPSSFEGLNRECKALLFAMMDTGCGFKELCGLDPEADILLDANVPYINVRHNSFRKLKTAHRGREIPLIGNALRAFQECPHGFPSYRRHNGSEAASALCMKFLRNHRLLETDEHSIYSLRHTFKDRLRTHHVPLDLQNYLMGHKDPSIGASYGSGYSLADKHAYLKKLEWDWG